MTTAGSATFTIPATGQPGMHVLEVLHGEFTFPYRSMGQSPEGDRPRFAVRFTVTQGAPVLPPPVSERTQQSVRRLPAAGALAVTPPFAAVGQPAAISGTGFTPGKRYALEWTTVIGNRVGGHGWNESSRPVAETVAEPSGRAEFHFTVPDDLGGAHALSVENGATKQTGSFWIKPTAFPLDVGHGPPGTPFTVHLKGVGWTETANIYTVVYDNSYIGYVCAFNSQGDVQIPLQATGDPGWHFIDLYPAIYRAVFELVHEVVVHQVRAARVEQRGMDVDPYQGCFSRKSSGSSV